MKRLLNQRNIFDLLLIAYLLFFMWHTRDYRHLQFEAESFHELQCASDASYTEQCGAAIVRGKCSIKEIQ